MAPVVTAQAPTVARRSQDLFISEAPWGGVPGRGPYEATGAIRDAYESCVWVHACVRAIVDTLSGLHFVAGTRLHDPTSLRPQSTLARLLGPPPGSPNPALTARRLWSHAVASYVVTGQFAWEVQVGQDGRPAGIWPLPVSNVTPIPHVPRPGATSTPAYFDGLAVRDGAKVRRLARNRSVYVWRPSLGDVRKPESALSAARLDIDVSVMQDRYDHAFLKNDAKPASVIVHEAFAEREERDRFRGQFTSTFGGVANAGKPVFVETEGGDGVAGALDVKPIGISQKDSDAIARSRQKSLAICAALGVPFSRLDASSRTFSNADAEDRTFFETRILPLVAELEDEVNAQLAPLCGTEVGWFDLRNVRVLRESRRIDREDLPALIEAGIISVAEARIAIGLEDEATTPRSIRAVS